MSTHNPVEITGNIEVHHPIKQQATVIDMRPYLGKLLTRMEWDAYWADHLREMRAA